MSKSLRAEAQPFVPASGSELQLHPPLETVPWSMHSHHFWGAPALPPGYAPYPHPAPNPVARKIGYVAVLHNLPLGIKWPAAELKELLAQADFDPTQIRRIDGNGGRSIFILQFKKESDRNQFVDALHGAVDVFDCCDVPPNFEFKCVEWPCNRGGEPPSWVLHLLQRDL
eukprot:457086-Amphidinium_carterae.1